MAQRNSPAKASATKRVSPVNRTDVRESESESEEHTENEIADSEYQECVGEEDVEMDEGDDQDSRLMSIIPEEDTLNGIFFSLV